MIMKEKLDSVALWIGFEPDIKTAKRRLKYELVIGSKSVISTAVPI